MTSRITVPFGDLKRQYESIRAELDAAVARTLASGWYILGVEVRAFEEAFAALCGVQHAIGVANGTEALQLAFVALGVGAGDEVITVANAGVYSTVTLMQIGARPIYVDVEAQSHNLDPALLEAAITPRTKAIMPVHLYGRMADMPAILAVAERHGVPVIEDCAQAHGALLDGRPAGSFGVCGCFSFYPSKNLGALGDGGALVTDDAGLAERLRRLRQYGWGRKYCTVDLGGMNSRLDEIQAALLAVKLRHLAVWNDMRRERAAWYDALLRGLSLELPQDVAGHIYHLYVVRVREREQLQAALSERGIATDVHYPIPAHLQPAYLPYGPPSGSLPVTEQLGREVLSLPIYPELTRAEVVAVATALRELLG